MNICHKTLAECGTACTCCKPKKTQSKTYLIRFGEGRCNHEDSGALSTHTDIDDMRRYGLWRPPGLYRVTFTLAFDGKYIAKPGAGIPDIRPYTERRDTSHFVNVCILPEYFVGKRVNVVIRKVKEG